MARLRPRRRGGDEVIDSYLEELARQLPLAAPAGSCYLALAVLV